MSDFGTPTLLSFGNVLGQKRAVVSVAGTASYDTNGSTIDLSAVGDGFTKVHGVRCLGVAAHGSDRYQPVFTPGASYSPSTGKLKVRDAAAGTAMSEVSSTTDLSSHTFLLEVIGT